MRSFIYKYILSGAYVLIASTVFPHMNVMHLRKVFGVQPDAGVVCLHSSVSGSVSGVEMVVSD